MSIRRALLCVSAGLLMAILTIGLLPILTIISWSEMMGIELMVTPLALFTKRSKRDSNSDCHEQQVQPPLHSHDIDKNP
ncbi:hypothetical protein ACX1C1_17065 [Paenibacillus sp. strain BS8-2]